MDNERAIVFSKETAKVLYELFPQTKKRIEQIAGLQDDVSIDENSTPEQIKIMLPVYFDFMLGPIGSKLPKVRELQRELMLEWRLLTGLPPIDSEYNWRIAAMASGCPKWEFESHEPEYVGRCVLALAKAIRAHEYIRQRDSGGH